MVERTPRDAAAAPAVAESLRQLSASLTRTGFGALNGVVRPLVRRGLGSPLPVGVGTVLLGTTGRMSGELREVPLVSVRVGDTLIVSTVRTRSNWIRNAEASPSVHVWVDGVERSGVAEVHHLPRLDVAVVRLTPTMA
jgi:hypothetical protein